MATEMVNIGLLVEDFDLWPRHTIDTFHINQMAEALRAGKTLPPILLGKIKGIRSKSLTIVDGIHRKRAYVRVEQTEIPAEIKIYDSRAKMLADAVKLNTTHGRSLTQQDKIRAIILMEKENFEPNFIASTLNVTLEKLREMRVSKMADFHKEPIALKQTTAYLAGESLTQKQVEYQKKAGGLHQTFYINQVIAMLEYSTVNWNNKKTVSALIKLFGLLRKNIKVAREQLIHTAKN